MHNGNKEFYFTLQESPLETEPKKLNQTYINYGFNHIGLVANTIDKIEKKKAFVNYGSFKTKVNLTELEKI